MAANGYVVNVDVVIVWDGVSQRIMRGTVIDSPAAGALVTAIGAGNLTALTSKQTASMNGQAVGPFCENLTGGGNEPSHSQN